jgi:predicted exporter
MSSTDTSTSSHPVGRKESLVTQRIWWIDLLALVTSVVVTLLLRVLAVSLFAIPAQFVSLQWARPIDFTVLGVIGAVLTFAAICRWARHPIRLFHLIALIVLLLSFLPDVALRFHYVPAFFPGFLAYFFQEEATIPAVATLALMHVTTYLITVGLLTGLMRRHV